VEEGVQKEVESETATDAVGGCNGPIHASVRSDEQRQQSKRYVEAEEAEH
jgi:hypothetical protein